MYKRQVEDAVAEVQGLVVEAGHAEGPRPRQRDRRALIRIGRAFDGLGEQRVRLRLDLLGGDQAETTEKVRFDVRLDRRLRQRPAQEGRGVLRRPAAPRTVGGGAQRVDGRGFTRGFRP